MCNPNREHHPPRGYCFAAIEPEAKSNRQKVEAHNKPILELGYHPLPERKSIGGESLKADWNTSIGVLDPPLGTKMS